MRLLSGGSSASHIPLVRFVLLGRIFSLGFLVSSGSAKLAPVRSCGWFSAMGTCGEFLLSVLSPEFWRFLWQRVTRHGTASTSLWLSLSSGVGFLTVAARRFFRRRCARHVPLLCVCGGLNGCIRSRDWRVGDSNLQFPISNDGTACQWTPLRAVGEAILNGLVAP
ncbi:hypothetical protein YC2023_020785 [Brassica napus]